MDKMKTRRPEPPKTEGTVPSVLVQRPWLDYLQADRDWLSTEMDRLTEVLNRIARSHGASDHSCCRRDLADRALAGSSDEPPAEPPFPADQFARTPIANLSAAWKTVSASEFTFVDPPTADKGFLIRAERQSGELRVWVDDVEYMRVPTFSPPSTDFSARPDSPEGADS